MEAHGISSSYGSGVAGISSVYRVDICLVFIRRLILFLLFFQFLAIARIQCQFGHIFKTAFALAVHNVGYRSGRNIPRSRGHNFISNHARCQFLDLVYPIIGLFRNYCGLVVVGVWRADK